MRIAIAILLLLSLAGCGSGSNPPAPAPAPGRGAPVKAGDLSDLDGKPLEEVVIALIPRLAGAGPSSADEIARSLDEKWNIHCENTCRIERK
jgi:hypothetical protein